jgi:hypothetical protein
MTDFSEQNIARLIAALPPAPEAWITAAQELPHARAAIDTLVARAEQSATERQAILADLDAALSEQGVAVSPKITRELRERLNQAG